MRGTRPTPPLLLVLIAVAALAAACGSSAGTGAGAPAGRQASLIQGNLRSLASGAPPGDHAYWLGRQFRHAPVSFVDRGWGRFALLSYHTFDGAVDADVDVETFAGRAEALPGGYRAVVRMASGQQVVLVFRSPSHPSAALVRAAQAALQPIPLGVRYLS